MAALGPPAEVIAALDEAEVYLGAAAALAPHDHEILHARAGLHAMRGEEAEARYLAITPSYHP